MGNRKQPFGYKMSLGEIVIQESEAKLVQEIFLRYIAGKSLNELTKSLRQQDIPYDGGRLWNKSASRQMKNAQTSPSFRKRRKPKRCCAGSVAHRHLNRWSKVSPTCSTVSQITRTAYSIGAVLRQSHIPKRRRRWIILWNNSQLTRTAPRC